MKHPQPGVGCGPYEWAVTGVVVGNSARQTAQNLLVHAATTLPVTEHPVRSVKGGRKGAKFEKATDRFRRSYIDSKCFSLNLQKIEAEKGTFTENNSTDAIRKYYAAFPPLHKDNNNAQQYIMSAPSWCRKPLESSENKTSVGTDGVTSREWLQARNRKTSNQRTRRNSYHSQRKNSTSKRRCQSFSKSFENETLPEWVTHEGVWDMETQDPVKEFIKALAMDEGYGTCENTMTDDTISFRFNVLECSNLERCANTGMALDTNYFKEENVILSTKPPTEEESLAKFKAKFDHSLEALWSRDQANTPDDECQELPVDFQELLSSPCNDFNSKCFTAQTSGGSIWSTSSDHGEDYFNTRANIWSFDNAAKELKLYNACNNSSINQECMDIIYNKLRPLNIKDDESPQSLFPSGPCDTAAVIWEPINCEKREAHLWLDDDDADSEPSTLYPYKRTSEPMPLVTNVMHSLSTLNHNKQLSSFTEVIPKWPTGFVGDGRPSKFSVNAHSESKYKDQAGIVDLKDEEDLLNSVKTHFKPIKHESGDSLAGNIVNYVDGTTFSIISDLEEVKFTRSQSGTMYLESESEPPKQYMEYRAKLTDKINFKNSNTKVFCDESENEFILKFQVRQIEKAIQTDNFEVDPERSEATPAKKLLLSTKTADIRPCQLSSVNEALKNIHQINVNIDEAELITIQNEKSAKELWEVCRDCKMDDIWKFDGQHAELIQTDENISKIWGSNDNVCRTCNSKFTILPRTSQTSGGKSVKEDSSEWDELLSDISYMHSLRIDKEPESEGLNKNEGCLIAPTEVSFSALDGDFIESALKFLETKRQEIPDVSRCGFGTNRIKEGDLAVKGSPNALECRKENLAWRCDRKRRHSATGRRAGGKLAALRSEGICETLGMMCPLPHDAPFLSCYSADRPLTR